MSPSLLASALQTAVAVLAAAPAEPLRVPLEPVAQPVAQPGTTSAQDSRRPTDPPEWRDNRRPDLRRRWDRLEGQPAPSLGALTDWTGSAPLDWSDLRGKVVLLDYWATWCGPCRAGIPHLRKLQERHAGEGLVVLGVHSARGAEGMAAFARSQKLGYTVAADRQRVLGKALGVQFLPSYFAIDRKGVVRVAGADRARLDAIVRALLAEPAPGDAPAADGSTASAGRAYWPPHVPKKVYAKDLRGKPAPRLADPTWLGPAPDLAGKVVVYDLWATWCAPCVRGIPDLNELQAEFADDVVVVGVSDEKPEVVRAFLENLAEKDGVSVGYAMAVDDGGLRRACEVQNIPNALVVSSDGVVRWQGIPQLAPDELTVEKLGRIVAADRAERAAAERTAREPDGASGGEGEGGSADPPGGH